MPDWLIWVAAAWLVCGVMGGRSCGWGRWERRGRHLTWPRDRARPDLPRARPPVRTPRPAPPETPEQRLQREFVHGRLTLEEYEAELWKELRPH